MTASEQQAFNPAIVQCLRIAYRRGRLIREAREAAQRAAEETETTPEDLAFYDDKKIGDAAEGA